MKERLGLIIIRSVIRFDIVFILSFSRMFSPNAVSNGNTDLPSVSDKRHSNILKMKKLYIFLGFITLFTMVTIALAASTLGVVLQRLKTEIIKTDANTTCGDGMLVCSIKIDDLMNHLQQLQKIADESSGGNRAIHTQGFNRTLDYIYNYLTVNTNLKVQKQFFNFNTFVIRGDPVLSAYINGAEVNFAYDLNRDFTYMQYSGSADFTDPVQLTSIPNGGCDDSDWLAATPSPATRVALVKRGICVLTQKSALAAEYNVAGLLIYNDGAAPDRNPPISASAHQEATFPALFLSYQAGTSLANAAQNLTMNAQVKIRISTEVASDPVGNICAHTVTGDATQTIVIGSHSDSVPAGPGINDNGKIYSQD
jgi:hypothetical protein